MPGTVNGESPAARTGLQGMKAGDSFSGPGQGLPESGTPIPLKSKDDPLCPFS